MPEPLGHEPATFFQTCDDKNAINRRVDDDLDDDLDELDEEDEEEEEDESEIVEERVPTPKTSKEADDDLDTDQETDRLLGQQYNDDNGYYDSKVSGETRVDPDSCFRLPTVVIQPVANLINMARSYGPICGFSYKAYRKIFRELFMV